jgi:hypothetical protein
VVPDIQGVSGGKVSILGDHSFGHSKQKNFIFTCDLFRTVPEIELSHCTVAWILAPNIVLTSRHTAPLSEACESV